MRPRILVRGAGEIASGIAHRLFRCGLPVACTERNPPTAVCRMVAFATAVTDGSTEIEGVAGRRWELADAWRLGEERLDHVPVFVDPEASLLDTWKPDILVDARGLGQPSDTRRHQAHLVIGLGPGLRAGRDVDAVIETRRGHDLGRILTEGEALPDTGTAGFIGGCGPERILRAPMDGRLDAVRVIGERVERQETVARVGGREVRAACAGVLRGLLPSGMPVIADTKIGDVDPVGDFAACFSISDRTRALSGAVLEVVLGCFPAAHDASCIVWPDPDYRLLDPTGHARYVHLVGGGGKTTLLYGWSRGLAREGHRVVCATTTRIRYPSPDQCPRVVLEPDPDRLARRVAEVLPPANRLAVVREWVPGSAKLLGHPPATLDTLLDSGTVDRILVEADGSAQRPHKVHAPHEPVVSTRADLVVVLVGIDVLGHPATETTVHNADLYRQRLGRLPEDLVHPGDLAVSLLHPEGWLRAVPVGVPVSLLVTHVRSPDQWQDAHAVARAVLCRDSNRRVRCVVAGDLAGSEPRLALLGRCAPDG
ncbi:MAG: EF2563 family selenium-dependent molybdenum hydroxylase system protein [Deltaproteobacteria bacterium]|nr:EF2563 family selenium-dependent molybdenum hydroxylase system protein [Deltaproteobacteria bacterium]